MQIDGSVLRRTRELRGWSRDRLAEEARISYSFACKLELGARTNPSPEVVARLAAALGCDIATLAAAPPRSPVVVL